jgi:hypothetical protein
MPDDERYERRFGTARSGRSCRRFQPISDGFGAANDKEKLRLEELVE